MDANKLQKLKDIGYSIGPSCGTCKHFQQHVDEFFGECVVNTYVHKKHTGGERRLSVLVFGHCNRYEQGSVEYMHGFKEFMEGPVEKT